MRARARVGVGVQFAGEGTGADIKSLWEEEGCSGEGKEGMEATGKECVGMWVGVCPFVCKCVRARVRVRVRPCVRARSCVCVCVCVCVCLWAGGLLTRCMTWQMLRSA